MKNSDAQPLSGGPAWTLQAARPSYALTLPSADAALLPVHNQLRFLALTLAFICMQQQIVLQRGRRVPCATDGCPVAPATFSIPILWNESCIRLRRAKEPKVTVEDTVSRRTIRNAPVSERKRTLELPLEWQAIWDVVEEKQEATPSRNSTTYSSIKRMVLAGQLGPGKKLVHEELAEALNVSRTPVREALERLYQEGFVTRLPRRGFYVTGISRDEAFSLYGAREALELFALQTTLEQGPIPKSALSTLNDYMARYDELTKTQVLTERILTDVILHLKLAELSGNRYVVRLLAQTFERLALKRRHEGYRYDRSKRAAAEHFKLLEALEKNDKRRSIQILRKHVLSARDALLAQLY